mmetsp:Transcript_1753/g.3372  ORF Transcript_1753/g.3372 Transcript_1753/m.3372 type:complete len:231 (-) Transcript_1753:60-752(-)
MMLLFILFSASMIGLDLSFFIAVRASATLFCSSSNAESRSFPSLFSVNESAVCQIFFNFSAIIWSSSRTSLRSLPSSDENSSVSSIIIVSSMSDFSSTLICSFPCIILVPAAELSRIGSEADGSTDRGLFLKLSVLNFTFSAVSSATHGMSSTMASKSPSVSILLSSWDRFDISSADGGKCSNDGGCGERIDDARWAAASVRLAKIPLDNEGGGGGGFSETSPFGDIFSA